MITRQREEFDADRFSEPVTFTKVRDGDFVHAVPCSLCNTFYYTDRVTFDRFMRSTAEGIDNPFVCDECSLEYEELEHGGQ